VVYTFRGGASRIITARRARKKETITRITLGEATRRSGEGRTDWDRLRREEAEGLEPERDPDEGEFDRSGIRVAQPRPKQAVPSRLDADVLERFRGQGEGYRTRINAVLRGYVDAVRRSESRETGG